MKLYTEEQVKKVIKDSFLEGIERNTNYESVKKSILNSLIPIEIPSDEEIVEMGKDVIIYNDTKRGWFIEGLKFMRDKIQGGNK